MSWRKLPSQKKIAQHWAPILIEMGLEIDYEIVHNIQCFTCGSQLRIERAHILAVYDGGSDDVSNLHNLCISCHTESEHINGENYWSWYKYKRLNCFNYPNVGLFLAKHKEFNQQAMAK